MPYNPNTYCVKPLQSNPFGSLPPFRYGAPLSESAVLVNASPSNDRGVADGGPDGNAPGSTIAGSTTGATAPGAAGPGGGTAFGIGNGRGFNDGCDCAGCCRSRGWHRV